MDPGRRGNPSVWPGSATNRLRALCSSGGESPLGTASSTAPLRRQPRFAAERVSAVEKERAGTQLCPERARSG